MSDYLLSLVPHFWVSQELFGSCGQVEFESEAKHVVHSSQEVQAAFNLLLDLESDGIKQNMDHLSGLGLDNITKHGKILSIFLILPKC